jgi:hypothetical protein
MTSDLDIYRTAKSPDEGVTAQSRRRLWPAKRADALIGLGDLDGHQVWKAVLRAVQELVRLDRKPSERVN